MIRVLVIILGVAFVTPAFAEEKLGERFVILHDPRNLPLLVNCRNIARLRPSGNTETKLYVVTSHMSYTLLKGSWQKNALKIKRDCE